MSKKWLVVISLMIFYVSKFNAAQITRVILASDTNPSYIQFWPLVATAWKKIVGIQPTLFFIAPEDYPIDSSVGDVIRINPVPGVSTSLQAQVIRLLGGAYFEDEICLISDIDMVPLSKSYFLKSVEEASEDSFIVYRNGHDPDRFPMCYNAAKGSVYKEVFRLSSTDEIPKKIIEWEKRGFGWNTDEFILTEYVKAWHQVTKRAVFLNHPVSRRIDRLVWMDRGEWGYDKNKLRSEEYIDAHLLRPLNKYVKENLSIIRDLGFDRQEIISIIKECLKQ